MGLLDYYRQFDDVDQEEYNRGLRERRAREKAMALEQIKKFRILDHDLSQETGELTPTLKVKRNVVNDKFADLVDQVYAAG